MTRHKSNAARRAHMQGDPVESDRLRPLFLHWVGKRSAATALRACGIPYVHGQRWLAGDCTLNNAYQAVVRRVLDEAGIAPSPAS